MANRKSRYLDSRPFTEDASRGFSFGGGRPREIGQASGVLEYTVREHDRLDLLALHFYVDSRKWWRILDANPEIVFGPDLTLDENVGTTILIPASTEPGVG